MPYKFNPFTNNFDLTAAAGGGGGSGTGDIDAVLAGTGLSGGGTTGSVTLSLANTAVTAGTYNNSATALTPFTVDAQGRLTGTGSAVTITPAFSVITGKPTTLSGYGITDAQASDPDLTAIAGLAGTSGFLKKTAANTWSLDTSTYLTGNQSITFSGDATGSGSTSVALTLANTAVTAGSYTNASLTVDSKGRITAASNGSALVTGVTGTAPIVSSGGTAPAISITAATTSAAGSMSAADKTKLDGIAAGAQVNVPTDLSYTAGTRLLESSTGTDVTLPLFSSTTAGLVSNSGGGTTNFLRADGTWSAAQPLDADLTAIGSLAGTSGFLKKTAADTWSLDTSTYLTSVTGTAPIVSSGGATPAISISAATTSAAGSMSASDKTKLDGIAAGAEVNVNADWTAVSGDAQILNKPTLAASATTDTTNASNITSGVLPDARLSYFGSSGNGIRKITTSTSDPTGGSDGDIWIKYTA